MKRPLCVLRASLFILPVLYGASVLCAQQPCATQRLELENLKWLGQPQSKFLSQVVATNSAVLKSAREDPEDDPEIAAAVAFSKLSLQQRALVLQKLPQRDKTPDGQVSTLKPGHVKSDLKAPVVSTAPDVRGTERMQQRVEAIAATKSETK
jgi:hypothetical protein